MITVLSGGRYTAKNWLALSEILANGLNDVCRNDCEKCSYTFACREVSQAITFCCKNANKKLAERNV